MTPQYSFQLVQSRMAHLAYLRLRRAIFCDEQRLFRASDEDAWDTVATPIVAVARGPEGGAEIVGCVRIYEAEPGVWYGGRLGVAPAHRRRSAVGAGLVRKAVTTAHGWGCGRFLALVQEPNVAFFEGLRWRPIEARTHRDRPHRLMEADLEAYPPSDEPRPATRCWEAAPLAPEEAAACP